MQLSLFYVLLISCCHAQADLEDVFENGLNFEGSFYFSQTYHDAPNPLLRLDKLGHVGLPLSQREAKCIAQHARQAPFGMGERTVVDTNVRDTWETDASEVQRVSPLSIFFYSRIIDFRCTLIIRNGLIFSTA